MAAKQDQATGPGKDSLARRVHADDLGLRRWGPVHCGVLGPARRAVRVRAQGVRALRPLRDRGLQPSDRALRGGGQGLLRP